MQYLSQNYPIGSQPQTSQGSITNPALGETLQNALSSPISFFSLILSNLISLSFIVGSVIFFAMLVFGAIQWISSGGDKQGLESARGRITNALVGIIILFASFAIVKLIETFFGFKILTLDIGALVIQ